MTAPNPANRDIAAALARIADLLEVQDADPYRVTAYRRGARRIGQLPTAAAGWVRSEDGHRLETLPDVGPRIAGLIREFVNTGRMALLERLEGAIEPEDLFRTVPGVGPELAARIHAHLEIESLEELEIAAHSGALETVPGIGSRRAAGIAHAVGDILNRAGRRRRLQHGRQGAPDVGLPPEDAPPVERLLAIDARYRRRAAAGRLKTITPRRFNPEGRAWLPILHAEEGPWHFTALYSNTARAHELGRTRDWVVIYYDRDGREGRCTVVTEPRGPDRGRRVVRGREQECRRHYATSER